MNKMNRHQLARVLDRAALTGGLPPDLAAKCTQLVAKIDAGATGINTMTAQLVADAWSATARAVANGAKPAALKAVLALEAGLGLGPVAEAVAEAPEERAAEAVDDDADAVDDDAKVASDNAAWSTR
jgi:hypothetical protein